MVITKIDARREEILDRIGKWVRQFAEDPEVKEAIRMMEPSFAEATFRFQEEMRAAIPQKPAG